VLNRQFMSASLLAIPPRAPASPAHRASGRVMRSPTIRSTAALG
jgi:hypothetical protein